MSGLVFLSIVCLICLGCMVFGGVLINVNDGSNLLVGYILVLFGTVALVLAIFVSPYVFKTGEPMTNIDKGEYHVAFIYAETDNVSVGIEKSNLKNNVQKINLYLYQFSRNAFEGPVKPNATTLKVVESGKFKKLILE